MKGNWFPSKPEKRNYSRVDVELDVDVTFGGKTLKASTTNLSCGGLFLPIKSEHKIDQQVPVEVALNLPDADGPVKVLGEISRLQQESLLFGYPRGVAIKFRGLYDENISAIDCFIKNKLH